MSWSTTLKQQILNLLPDNISQLITPMRVRDAMGVMLDFLEKSIQYAVPEPQKRTITVFRGTDRSWPITLSGSANTIGLFAFTTITKRMLILGEHFIVTGSGVNRIFSISEETFDDFYPGEKIVYQENVKGGQIEFKIPQFVIQEVNGGQKYGWEYPDDPSSFTVIGNVSEPKFVETSSIPVTNYQAYSSFHSPQVSLAGKRLLSAYVYTSANGVEVLEPGVQVIFDSSLSVFTFSTSFSLTTAKIIYRTEPL